MALLSATLARRVRRHGRWAIAGALLGALGALRGAGPALVAQSQPGPSAPTAQAAEYHLKAVFLFNFAQFVEWPPAAFPDSQAPLVIGILGDDPFGDFLDETVRGEHLDGRPFAVRRYRTLDDVKACHILFISQSEGDRSPEILRALRDRPILTVSDDDGFAEHGGMIEFVTDRRRIRLRINLEAGQRANLTISSKLLRVAEIVTPAGR